MSIFTRTFNLFADIIVWAIIIRSFSSIFFSSPNRFTDVLFGLTEPILAPLRRIMYSAGMNTGNLDFTPLVAIIIINIIRSFIIGRF